MFTTCVYIVACAIQNAIFFILVTYYYIIIVSYLVAQLLLLFFFFLFLKDQYFLYIFQKPLLITAFSFNMSEIISSSLKKICPTYVNLPEFTFKGPYFGG